MFMIKNKKRFWGKVLLIVSLLLGGILISEPSEKEPKRIWVFHSYSNYNHSGYEHEVLQDCDNVAVVRIIRKKREYSIQQRTEQDKWLEPFFLGTIIEAEVEDVLYGSLQKGKRIYLWQSGTSFLCYTDGALVGLTGRSKVEESGGFYRWGERLLLNMNQYTQTRNGESLASWLALNPEIPIYRSSEPDARSVTKKHQLVYRKDTLYQPGQIGYEYIHPYWDSYHSISEIREAIPELFRKAAEQQGTPITEDELQEFSRNHFAKVSGIITQGMDEWKAFVEEYRAKGK
jgi:hypothetical protein